MDKLMRAVERVLQVATILVGIVTIVEMITTYMHKKQLRHKAEEYLVDELEFEGNVGGPIAVFSPELTVKEKRVKGLLAATGVGCILVVLCHLCNDSHR